MNKKKYTISKKWLAPLIQVAFLFLLFTCSSMAEAAGDTCETRYPSTDAKFQKLNQECNECWSGALAHPFMQQTCLMNPGSNMSTCIAGGTGTKNPDTKDPKRCFEIHDYQGKNIARFMLIPLQFLITYVAYIMAFYFLSWGLYRLRHSHEGGGAMKNASGTGSFLCFVAAALLFQYQYAVKLVGESFLGPHLESNAYWDYSSGSDTPGGNRKLLPIDPKSLFGYYNLDDGAICSGGHTGKQCYAYGIVHATSGILVNRAPGWDGDEYATLETLFATLMIIGFISFVRGAMLLVKAGEGMHSGESTGTKALTHILAGGLLCNANHVASVLNNVISNTDKSGIS